VAAAVVAVGLPSPAGAAPAREQRAAGLVPSTVCSLLKSNRAKSIVAKVAGLEDGDMLAVVMGAAIAFCPVVVHKAIATVSGILHRRHPARAPALPPLVIAPRAAVPYGTSIGTNGAFVSIYWSAIEFPGSTGLVTYELFQSTDGGTPTQVPLPSATSTSTQVLLAPGRRYAFGVAAHDDSGWSRVVDDTPVELLLLDDASLQSGYAGLWSAYTNSSAYEGGFHRTVTSGDTLSWTFFGSAVAWIGPQYPDAGRTEIDVDGRFVGFRTATGAGSTSTDARNVLFSWVWPSAGQHTLVLRFSPTALATSLIVDAIVVLD
jgi:hypothetical protein